MAYDPPVSTMFNRLHGQPESYERKYVHTTAGPGAPRRLSAVRR